jgi:nitrogen regulatory protein P-II 1
VQLISAIVRPTKVSQICEALGAFGFAGLTVLGAAGMGKMRGHAEIYRGVEYPSPLQPEVKIEIVVRDEDTREVVDVICRVAHTGSLGDGKVWITPVGDVVRIRTKEWGADAL